MSEFSNKVIVITGAAGALGQAVASYFSSSGAKVAYLDYSEDAFKASFGDYKNDDQHSYIVTDLTSRASCQQAADHIIEQWGNIHVLANIAGGFTMGEPVHETSDDTWDFLFNLNTRSIVNTSAAFVPNMLNSGSGKIINISAGAAHQGIALMGAYVASKSAVLRLTETMAQELRTQNINVNAILPGTIDTDRNRQDMPDADHDSWVKPEKIAEVIGFLCSGAASAIHGAGIPVVGLS